MIADGTEIVFVSRKTVLFLKHRVYLPFYDYMTKTKTKCKISRIVVFFSSNLFFKHVILQNILTSYEVSLYCLSKYYHSTIILMGITNHVACLQIQAVQEFFFSQWLQPSLADMSLQESFVDFNAWRVYRHRMIKPYIVLCTVTPIGWPF